MGAEPWEQDALEAEERVEAAKEAAIQFEAVKSHYRQTKEGIALTLNLNPAEAPPEIALSHVGQRFLCVLVPIDQHEEPQNLGRKSDGAALVQKAGIACKDERFQRFLNEAGLADELSEEAASVAVRDHCQIVSRSELATNPEAARRFRDLYRRYLEGALP
ncbi:hypothetical protein [Planktothrix phage Pra-JY27]|nr:DNA packaging protein [Planktothrix phage Pag-Yong1]WEV89232.1 hypothetical protein [Synechococcus phage MinM2]